LRQKIGVMYGSPETTSGGNSLKFYASIRLDIRRIGAIKSGEEVVGNETRVKVVKNKLAPPFREAEFAIRYGEGIDLAGEMLDAALERGVITASGGRYRHNDVQVAYGREAAREWAKTTEGKKILNG
jgi:recombination protein RecA